MTKEAEKRIAELHQELLAFSEQGRPDLALPVGREAYELSQKNLNQDGELYMTSLLHLAAIEHALGNLDRAEPLYGEAIETVGRVVGMWDPVYAGVISKRAHLYHQLGRHVEAETDMKKSVEIRLEFYKEPHPDMVDDYSLLADLAEDRADYGDAKAHYLTALDILRKGKDDLPVASVLNKLGNLGKYLGNPEEAEQYLKEALDIRRRELGENAKEVGISLLNLASVYQNQADYGGARHAFDQGLEILQKTMGEESPIYAIALANSANLFRETGEYQKAAQRYIRAISILRTNPKVSSDDLTTAISNLGEVYLEMGRYAESRPLLEEALDTRRKSLPKGDPRLAYTLTNLAGLHQSTGDYASAEALHEEALKINMASFGEEHPEVAKNLHNLAGLYMLTGQDRKAEKTYNQSLDIIRHFYDDEHPSVALSIRKLGDLHMQMGNYIQAEGYYRQSREINSRTLGKVHPQVATDVFNLAKLYMAMGDYTRAERYFLEALELDIASTGQAHPNLLKTLNALADLYVGQGRYKEAVEQGLRALQIIVKTGQLNELPHAATLNVIGLAATYAGDFSAAEEAQRQAVTIRREILGEEHPEYAVSLNNLGLIYDKKGDYEQAEQYYRQALEIKDALVGTSDTGYVTARRNLAVLLAATGRANEALPMMEAVAQAEDRTIGQIFGIGSERQRMAFLRTIQKYYYAFLSLVWLNQTQSTRAKRKAYSLVLRRKGIGAEALAVQRDAVLTDKYPALKSKLNQFFTLRKRVARFFLEADGLSPAGTASMLEDLQEKKDQLEAELVRSIPEMQLTDTFEQTNVQTIADALPDDSVLVEFVRFNPFNFKAIESQGESQWQPPHYLAFVLLAGKPGAVEILSSGRHRPAAGARKMEPVQVRTSRCAAIRQRCYRQSNRKNVDSDRQVGCRDRSDG
jgi:tetratricopeptide (TPR) repeat protein